VRHALRCTLINLLFSRVPDVTEVTSKQRLHQTHLVIQVPGHDSPQPPSHVCAIGVACRTRPAATDPPTLLLMSAWPRFTTATQPCLCYRSGLPNKTRSNRPTHLVVDVCLAAVHHSHPTVPQLERLAQQHVSAVGSSIHDIHLGQHSCKRSDAKNE